MKEKWEIEEEHWEKMRILFAGQKQHTWDYRDKEHEGMFRVEIIHNGYMHNDGFKEIWRHSDVDLYDLQRKLEKCMIKSFKVSRDFD